VKLIRTKTEVENWLAVNKGVYNISVLIDWVTYTQHKGAFSAIRSIDFGAIKITN
jgi:hypothetical protein